MSPENALLRTVDGRRTVNLVETRISRNGDGWLLGGQPAELQKVGDGKIEPGEHLVYVEHWGTNGHGGIKTSAVVVAGRDVGGKCYVRAIPVTVVGGQYSDEGDLRNGAMRLVRKTRLSSVVPRLQPRPQA